MSKIIYICGKCDTEWIMEDVREGLSLSVIPCIKHWAGYEENGEETCPVCNEDLRSEYSDVMTIPHKTREEKQAQSEKLERAVELLGKAYGSAFHENKDKQVCCESCRTYYENCTIHEFKHKPDCAFGKIQAFIKEVEDGKI